MSIFNFKKKELITAGTEGGLEMLLYKNNSSDLVFGKDKALSYYEKSVYVNKAIEKRAEKVGQIQFYLKDKKGNKITDHDLLDILAKPNRLQTGEQFFALWQKFFDIYGEVYILILKDKEFLGKDKIELRLLEPSKCEPKFDADLKLEKVTYEGDKIYTGEEIIYDYRPNPRNQFRGASLLRAGAYTIDTNIELDKLNYNLVKAGGKVEGIINFKGEQIQVQQLTEFKAKYKEQLESMAENGNVIFMGGDAEYQRVNLTPEELGYMGSKKMSLNDICILTDVPQVLLNSLTDIKYDNADASIKMFLSETIVPLMRQKTNKLNEATAVTPKELELCFVDPTPEDIDKALKINENGAKNYYLTPNEMRANIGKEPIEGGDDIILPFNMTTSPAVPSNKGLKKKEFNHPLRDYDFRRKYFTKRIKEQDGQEAIFKRELNKYLKGQRDRLIDSLGGKEKSLLDSSFNQKLELTIGKEMLMPMIRDFMEMAGSDAKDLVGSNYEFVWTQELEASLNARTEFFLNSINETTFAQLQSQFTESLEAGESRNDLIKRIENTYGDISKGRANTIARTEVHASVSNGTFEGYKQAGLNIKIWVAVIDDKTRPEHEAMDGEEVPIDHPFSNGQMFPDEPNCRCQI